MKLKLKWKIIFSVILIILIIFFSAKYIGNSGIRVKEYKVKNENVPIYGLKIVQFSDLYYGKSMNLKKLNTLVETINKTKPDIVIFSGDLIDKKTEVNQNIADDIKNSLLKINSTYGNYYVNGDIDEVNKTFDNLMESSNFNKLNDTITTISTENGDILITGINTNNRLNDDITKNISENEYKYKIFVSHYPDKIDDALKYNYELILSSHSLNGQIRLPIIGGIFKFDNAKRYNDAYYKIDNSDLYITAGLGNRVLNIRTFNKPSFNLYRLVN